MTTSLRVLILEDYALDAELMVQELHLAGYTPDWRRVANEADYLDGLAQTPELVLADYTLPQFNALSALRLLQERGLDIPFIVVTGTVGEEAAVECMKQGAADYLLKDRLARLGPAVAQALEQKRLQREKARAEEALRQSEALYRLLTDNAQDMISRYAADGALLYVSPACQRLTGYTPEEMLGQTAEPFMHPDDVGQIRETVYAAIAAGEDYYSVQHRMWHRQGHWLWVETNGRLLRNAQGELSEVHCATRDITERKRAEQEIEQLNRHLARRAQELAALNAASCALSTTLDLDTLLPLLIDQIKNLLDTQAASVLLLEGEELVFAAAASPSAEKLVGTRLPITAGVAGWAVRERQAVRLEDAQHDGRFFDGIDALTDMSTRSLLAVPLLSREIVLGVVEVVNKLHGAFDAGDLDLLQSLAGSAALAIENAQLYQAEHASLARLQESQAQLIQSEKMAALGRLVASIAHEVNNPLQAIQNALELAEEETGVQARPDKLVRYLNIARGEVERLAGIMRRTRDFYRPAREEGHPTDVNAVLQSVLELTGSQLQRARVSVEQEEVFDLPPAQANADHLKQVFLNLILNAMDAMSPDGGTLSICTAPDQMLPVNSRQPLPAVRIEFKDTGAGIPAETLPRVFEPFVTTKEHGTGLGLAVSYGLIQACGGQISVSSQVGTGTTFTVWLPTVPANVDGQNKT